jgi:hypothetical protein
MAVLPIDLRRCPMKSKVHGALAAMGCLTMTTVFAVVGSLMPVPAAFAQSSDDVSAVTSAGDATAAAIADPPADDPIDSVAPLAAADNSSSDDAAERHSGWERTGDAEQAPTDSQGKVLEVPPAAKAAAQSPGNGAAPSSDQVGSIDDYQYEDDGTIGGVYIAPVPLGARNPYGIGTTPSNPGINPPFLPRYVPMPAPGANVAPPGANLMNAAIGPTSPMMPSRMPIPGGWYCRQH